MASSTHAVPPDGSSPHDGAPSSPEVTVSMPAHNAAPFIRQAIQSVLAQRDVALELIVVDDASTDDTAAIAESISDPRLRVLRNPRRRGVGACHNLALRHGRGTYVAQVDAADFVLGGALRRMLDALAADPTAGQAHCHCFDIDRDGLTTRDAFAARWRQVRSDDPQPIDHRDEPQWRGAANALRTFPRRVLDELGGFDERVPYGVEDELALRVAERYRIVLVPELLYARRRHGSDRDGSSRATTSPLHLGRLLRGRWHDAGRATGSFVIRSGRRLRAAVRWRLWEPLAATLYQRITATLPACTLPPATTSPPNPARIAYFLRAFPVPSETFIQREVSALRERGLSVEVIADVPVDPELYDRDARAAAAATVYLGHVEKRTPAALGAFLVRRPWTVARLYAYVLSRRHTDGKSRQADRAIWYSALRLGGVLVARGATHVHAPWAFGNALVTLLAARLAGIGFSVQARASDLYRDTSQQGLEERLGHADFIITNARYNEATIRSRLPPATPMPIHVIYEGVDLQRLEPAEKRANDVPLILSVARLVEPKGLEVLLRACRLLKDAGRSFRCEIVGGRDAREMNYYLSVMKLHRALGLEEDVRFLGPRPFAAVVEKYVEADVYVLPSVPTSDGRRDVTPNVVIEAMAMGLPIVSSRSGAIAELIVDTVSGLLVPPRDEAALAHALGRLLDDADLRRTFGAAARAAAEARFDIHRNAAQYAALFGRPR